MIPRAIQSSLPWHLLLYYFGPHLSPTAVRHYLGEGDVYSDEIFLIRCSDWRKDDNAVFLFVFYFTKKQIFYSCAMYLP